ncbi:MAG: PAS domain S-box-containing protein [Candidatus Latescibacterota bacterium]
MNDLQETHKGRILVVDDEEPIRTLLCRGLAAAGYESSAAANFTEMCQQVADKTFDLVTLDIMMPGTDGLQALAWLREHHPDIGVVMATAIDDMRALTQAMRLGAYSYVLKPLELELITQEIARAMERVQLVRENREYQHNLEHKVEERTQQLSYANEQLHAQIQEIEQRDEEIRKLDRAIEQSPISVVITDPQGTIEYVNPKFCQLTGYSKEDVIGQNPRVLKSGNHSDELYADMWRTISAGDPWHGEFSNKKKDGTFYWEIVAISPLRDAEGTVTHFVSVKEDITARKQAEEDLSKANAQLQRQLREMEGRDRLVQIQMSLPENERTAYEEMLHIVADVMSSKQAGIYFPTGKNGSLRRYATLGVTAPAQIEIADEFADKDANEVFTSGKPQAGENKLLAPILYRSEALGVISVSDYAEDSSRDTLCRLASEMALVLRALQMAEDLTSGALEIDELLKADY